MEAACYMCMCTHMHRHYLSFFKVLHTQFEQGPPVQVITEFSSALNKYITHLELCYPLSNPFFYGTYSKTLIF